VIRGTVADRPWGKTLGSLARRGVTGQLSVRNHNARFQVAFHQGLVIAAASSSGSAESAVNLAFRQGLITPAQLESIQKGLDDWDLLSECLDPIQIGRLQRQALAGCVARTFVLEHGEFTFDSQITLRVLPNAATHVGGIIYHGARMYLGETRLRAAVRMLGTRFTFRQQEDLRHFAFSEPDMQIIETVLEGTSASSLDAIGNEHDRRIARAAVYALATCGVLHCEAPQVTASHPIVKRPSARLARGTTEPGRAADGTPSPRRTPGYRTAQVESARVDVAPTSPASEPTTRTD
jgi:hypothetical protein